MHCFSLIVWCCKCLLVGASADICDSFSRIDWGFLIWFISCPTPEKMLSFDDSPKSISQEFTLSSDLPFAPSLQLADPSSSLSLFEFGVLKIKVFSVLCARLTLSSISSNIFDSILLLDYSEPLEPSVIVIFFSDSELLSASSISLSASWPLAPNLDFGYYIFGLKNGFEDESLDIMGLFWINWISSWYENPRAILISDGCLSFLDSKTWSSESMFLKGSPEATRPSVLRVILADYWSEGLILTSSDWQENASDWCASSTAFSACWIFYPSSRGWLPPIANSLSTIALTESL